MVRNMKGVNVISPMTVNVLDVIGGESVVLDKDSVSKLEERLNDGK
jgi:ribosomal protein L4